MLLIHSVSHKFYTGSIRWAALWLLSNPGYLLVCSHVYIIIIRAEEDAQPSELWGAYPYPLDTSSTYKSILKDLPCIP